MHTAQIKGIVEVYEELSAIKMKTIRDEILGTREFLERLANLSNEVGNDLSTIDEIPNSAVVYLSASSGMYGDLPEKVFNAFLNYIKINKATIFIFGKQGKTYVDKYRPNLKFVYYELDDKKKNNRYHDRIFKITFKL